ncbi:winged helix-turn-helix transcriptional regulator (plasmid) [Photobacterium sp. GJ3]|uniref:sugar-binding transcriptional regulator n=1 Tax=Photobacterium sp. GJ3 TaxID=2829502 RepID=UPI001B8CCDBF|nr:sugar-binding domain-containing protein [Photobacterium sp. GJ3]QUJ69991.1 winged helix-turn-helix transcriptional regulator [Photobacterium sp. GJ3]
MQTTIKTQEVSRLVSQVLFFHYKENRSQAEISKTLDLSPAKVNRIIRQAREEGLVEIILNIPHVGVLGLEKQLIASTGLSKAVLCPSYGADQAVAFTQIAEMTANYLLETLRKKDVICISGGKALARIVAVMKPVKNMAVTVVPATGGVQGRHFTDVNYLASALAEKLGGKSLQLHAPLFADTQSDRDMLVNMRASREVLELARHADIALAGIGAVAKGDESYFDLRHWVNGEKSRVAESQCKGEVFAHLFDASGEACIPALNDKLVGLTLEELRQIPVSIGVAAGAEKVAPIQAALRGGFLNTLITDELTAQAVLDA